MPNKAFLLVSSFLLSILTSTAAGADTLKVAVASNFADTLHQLADRFDAKTGNTVLISSGSTGKLYTQIANGAPFDIFMAADEKRPDLLLKKGLADASHASVYAQGKLVFVSNIPPTGECRSVMSDARVKRTRDREPENRTLRCSRAAGDAASGRLGQSAVQTGAGRKYCANPAVCRQHQRQCRFCRQIHVAGR